MQSINSMSDTEAAALAVVKSGQIFLRMQDLLVRVLGVRDSHQLTQKARLGHPKLSAAVGKAWETHCAFMDVLQTFPGWENWMLDGRNEQVREVAA